MAEDDERWRKDGTVMKSHDQLISLELPHLVRDGLDFKEGVAVKQKNKSTNCASAVDVSCKMIELSDTGTHIYLKTAMSKLTRRMFATRR